MGVAHLLAICCLFSSPGCASRAPDDPNQLVIWAFASQAEHWRADNAYDAWMTLKKETSLEVFRSMSVSAVNDPASLSWGDYKKKFVMAAEAGMGPDIILSGHEDIAIWAQAGYIVPLADSIEELTARHPEFEGILDRLWTACTWRGKVWAIPQDVECRPMYFSKTKLKELGWSDDAIDHLPERIQYGEFTLDDMIATAEKAVRRGVVAPGHGYWPRPLIGADFLQFYVAYGGRLYDPDLDKLVITEEALIRWYQFQRRCVTTGVTPDDLIGTAWRIWHDTVAHNRVLFWNGGSWHYADWAENYLSDVGGARFLREHIGYALIPSGIRGRPAGTLSHPVVYMITSASASGKAHQRLSLHLLAKMTTPALNDRHALESTHLGILKHQMYHLPPPSHPRFAMLSQRRDFLRDISYMLRSNYFLPNHALYPLYFDILWENMLMAQTGKTTPEEAARTAMDELRAELGEELIIE